VASNGKEALDAIPLVKPDIVTLDLNMPVMDGLETLRQLHTIYPKSRVIMVSSYTTDGAQATLNALDAGGTVMAILDIVTI
jgi:two-component system chemotaxis response regulator CheB